MKTRAKSATPYINVTPLIDVLLVLLIIFMVAAPFKPFRFKALVPSPPEPGPVNPVAWDLNLRVDLSSDKRLSVNRINAGSLDDPAELVSVLRNVISDREAHGTVDPRTGAIAKTVYINAPRSVRYGDVAKVIDNVKQAGANPIGLQVDELGN